MNETAHPSAKRFKAMVCAMLELPTRTREKTLRNALKLKGPEYLKWYDTRVGAITQYLERHSAAGSRADAAPQS